MSRPRFLADEDSDQRIVRTTRKFEPALEFASVHEFGLSGRPDHEVLEFAASEDWIVVSHDVNTMIEAAKSRIRAGALLGGLFLTSQASRRRRIAESLVLVWSASEGEEWRDRIEFLPFS